MSDTAQNRYAMKFRLMDFPVTLFCLLGSVYSIIMFRPDLFRALDAGEETPVGTFIAGGSTQRRMTDWLLWDDLSVDAHIYSGDTIRTADHSGAILSIEGSSVNLNEKTLIRIQRSQEDEGFVVIYLDEGNIVLTTAAGGGNLVLNLMGRQLETGPGTVLSASAGKDGAVVKVSEGTAVLAGDGQRREIASGTMIALDSGGGLKDIVITEPLAAADTPEPALPSPVAEQPVPLPAPLNLQPPTGHRIGIEHLKVSRSIDFTWSAVQGADAYIFTLYDVTDGSRRQIIRVPPGSRRDWTLESIETIGEGTFVWQVEAVNRSSEGTVGRRGRIAENSFVIDIPRSGIVQIDKN